MEDFQQCWEELGEVQRGTGKSVPLYCDNRELLEMVKRGRMGEGEEAKGDDTRSIAHQVSSLLVIHAPHSLSFSLSLS